METPNTYTISFDNQCVTTTFETTPPEDFTGVLPEPSTEVSRDGFELTWEPSGDDDVTIGISITGLILSYAEDWSVQIVEHAVSFVDLVTSSCLVTSTLR